MPRQPLHIPFATGQNEGFDRKMLPVGPMREVRNLWLERDGRYARRNGTAPKTRLYNDGAEAESSAVVHALTSRGVIFKDTVSGSMTHHTWEPDVTGTERIVQSTGRPTRVSRVDRVDSSPGSLTRSVANAETELWETDPDYEVKYALSQKSACVDVCYDGTIVFVYVVGYWAVLEFRHPETLALLHKKEHRIGSSVYIDGTTSRAGTTSLLQEINVRVAASKQTDRIVLVSWYTAPASNENTNIHVLAEEFFNTAGEQNEFAGGRELLHGTNTNAYPHASSTPIWSVFDVMARPESDSYIILAQTSMGTGTHGAMQLKERQFTGLESETLATLTMATGPLASTVGCSCSATRWYAATVETIHSSLFGDAVAPETLTVDDPDMLAWPPSCVQIGAFETKVVYGHSPAETEDDPNDPNLRVWGTRTLTWTHPGGYAPGVSSVGEVGFEVPITKAVATSGRSAAFLAEFIQSNNEPENNPDSVIDAGAGALLTPFPVIDVAKEPFWSPAHIMESDGLTGRSYVASYCLEGGSRYWDHVLQGPRSSDHEPAQATPISYTLNGEVHTLYPVLVFKGSSVNLATESEDGTFHAALFRTVAGRSGSIKLRDGDVLAGGIVKHAGVGAVIQGFTGPPTWVQLFYETVALSNSVGLSGGDEVDDTASIKFCATMEYVDDSGRLWRSAPCVSREVLLPPIVGSDDYHHEITISFAAHSGMPSPGAGCKLVLYGTNPNEETFYRRGEQFAMPGQIVSWHWGENGYSDARASTEVLYTTGDVLANGCPPAAQFVAEANGRLWAGGGIDKTVIQASKPLNALLGVEWNSLDSFKVFMPGDVTGMAALDSAVVAFTRDGAFVIHGSGPDLGGVGSFSEPQAIPSVAGCINHRSVISTQEGVFFQSPRGIEMLGRGFASPRFVGEAVRDTVEAAPYCFGVIHSQRDGLVRWLFGESSTGSATAVVIYDSRCQGWYTFTYTGMGFRHINRIGDDIVMASLTLNSIETETETEAEDEGASNISVIETGSIRVAGVQGWAFGRRINLLGEFGGKACMVTIRMAFNDEPYNDDDVLAWSLTSEEYGVNAPVELEVTLPVQKFSSIRFKVEINPTGTTGSYSFKPNGVSLYHTTSYEGPRLGSRNAG